VDDLSSAFRKQDYILGGQSVIPQPMCQSQLQSEITHTDENRTEKFITLASKSAVQGYEISQNEDIYASSASSPKTTSQHDHDHHNHHDGFNNSGAALIESDSKPNNKKTSKVKRKHSRKERKKDKKQQQ
jgi:hypothetical protein